MKNNHPPFFENTKWLMDLPPSKSNPYYSHHENGQHEQPHDSMAAPYQYPQQRYYHRPLGAQQQGSFRVTRVANGLFPQHPPQYAKSKNNHPMVSSSSIQSGRYDGTDDDCWNDHPRADLLDHGKGSYYPKQQPSQREYERKLNYDEKLRFYKDEPQVEQPVPSVPEVQVAPGEYLPLRGAEETWRAIQVDFYLPCGCVGCDGTIFCIQDAEFVLCPCCKSVGPMSGGGGHGVGIGFTMEDLAKWQKEIQYERKQTMKNNNKNY